VQQFIVHCGLSIFKVGIEKEEDRERDFQTWFSKNGGNSRRHSCGRLCERKQYSYNEKSVTPDFFRPDQRSKKDL
jgi:hypothetical protein